MKDSAFFDGNLSPTKLFGSDSTKVKENYIALLKTWHPDLCKDPKASEVTQKIQEAYDLFKRYGLYLVKRPHELGSYILYPDYVVYAVEESKKSLIDMSKLLLVNNYPNTKFETEFTKYIPKNSAISNTLEPAILISMTSRAVPLRDVIFSYDGKIPVRHVGWILNSIFNTLTYLHKVKNTTFVGLTIDNIFVVPDKHWALFVGGWWHATTDKIKSAPRENYALGASKEGFDVRCAKALGLQLLGDRNGVSLWKDKDIPQNILLWLMGSAQSDPLDAMKSWKNALRASFGEPKFVSMDLDRSKLYL